MFWGSENSDFRLQSDSAFAIQSLIWSFGSKAYQGKDYQSATMWFTLGTHSMFHAIYDFTFSKLVRYRTNNRSFLSRSLLHHRVIILIKLSHMDRKAALSYIHDGDSESARSILSRLTPDAQNTAGCNFIGFMIETASGNETSGKVSRWDHPTYYIMIY